MNQLDAELRRFFARRIVRGTLLGAVLIAIFAVGLVTAHGHAARGQSSFVPIAANQDTRMNVGTGLHGTLEGLGVAFLFVGAGLGASFIGAEFFLGSLTSQLLFEPRRWRVHLAKSAAVALGVALTTLVICVVVGASMFVGSAVHGVMQGIDADWWRHRAVDLARAVGAGSAAGVMAYCFTLIARRTSATIAGFLAQYPFIFIVDDHRPVFGVVSRFAPVRGLIAISADPRTGNSAIYDDLRTNAAVVVFVLAWVVALVVISGVVFARSEVR